MSEIVMELVGLVIFDANEEADETPLGIFCFEKPENILPAEEAEAVRKAINEQVWMWAAAQGLATVPGKVKADTLDIGLTEEQVPPNKELYFEILKESYPEVEDWTGTLLYQIKGLSNKAEKALDNQD